MQKLTLDWLLEEASHGYVQMFRNGDHTIVYTWTHGYQRLDGDHLVAFQSFGEGPCEGREVPAAAFAWLKAR